MKLHRYFSPYIALVIWALAGFMAQPTVASLFVHILLLPALLALVLWIAHWEGRREAEKS